ncbi:hypothetical protein M231_07590 [Tremella mesenterica]|uniref:Uncharacterized protein n=1 Tax=Tremella mesenterica TaxID=5217 RepID=A0A4Q1B8Z7_TREME|nr:hypothetical protein M231_07590 [Tremella mesenterica]
MSRSVNPNGYPSQPRLAPAPAPHNSSSRYPPQDTLPKLRDVLWPSPGSSHASYGHSQDYASGEDIKPSLSDSHHGDKHRLNKETDGDHKGDDDSHVRKKRAKKSTGRACVYCRRSHMSLQSKRHSERDSIKREIPHLCRDPTSPIPRQSTELRSASPSHMEDISPVTLPTAPPTANMANASGSSQLPPTLYEDTSFSPAWPLLPDTTATGPTYVDGTVSNAGQSNWPEAQEPEFGALSKFLLEIGVPFLPSTGSGSWLDILTAYSKKDQPGSIQGTTNGVPPADLTTTGLQIETRPNVATSGPSSLSMQKQASSGSKGKAKSDGGENGAGLVGKSRFEEYLLAAADQPSGPRAARLAQVIKAKYDAGLLKPYDYVKGYERMNKWMESGRAAPKADSVIESAPSSPSKREKNKAGSRPVSSTPVPTYANSISPESRRRILAALNGFRPKFRQIARTLTDVDLVFIEEAMERWMLEYDRAFAYSAVRFWEGYAKVGLDAGQRALYLSITLKIPQSLTRRRPSPKTFTPSLPPPRPAPSNPLPPDFSLPGAALDHIPSNHLGGVGVHQLISGGPGSDSGWMEQYNIIKCCFSATIRRDAWGVPVAIMGQFIPQVCSR